jgi:hypothetical protein
LCPSPSLSLFPVCVSLSTNRHTTARPHTIICKNIALLRFFTPPPHTPFLCGRIGFPLVPPSLPQPPPPLLPLQPRRRFSRTQNRSQLGRHPHIPLNLNLTLHKGLREGRREGGRGVR